MKFNKEEKKHLKSVYSRVFGTLEVTETDLGYFLVSVDIPFLNPEEGGNDGERTVKVLVFRDPVYLSRAFQIARDEMTREIEAPQSCWGENGNRKYSHPEYVSLDGSPTKRSQIWRNFTPEMDP